MQILRVQFNIRNLIHISKILEKSKNRKALLKTIKYQMHTHIIYRCSKHSFCLVWNILYINDTVKDTISNWYIQCSICVLHNNYASINWCINCVYTYIYTQIQTRFTYSVVPLWGRVLCSVKDTYLSPLLQWPRVQGDWEWARGHATAYYKFRSR